MQRLTFVAQSARDASNVAVSSERLLNCYAEAAPGDARTRLNIRTVPGEAAFSTLSTGLFRVAARVGDEVFAIANGTLYSLSKNGAVTSHAVITDDENTIMAAHGTYPIIAAAAKYRVWDGATLQTVTGGVFGAIGSVEFIDQYVILTESNGQRFQWSDLADPLTLDPLNFQTADARNDNLRRAIAFGGQLWLFGEESIEIWINTNQSGVNAFQRLAGSVIDRGLKSKKLICRHPFGILFIGNDDVAYSLGKGGLEPISTPAVNTALKEGTPTECFYYENRGHLFLCIRFSDRPAWCYDFATKLWHERSSGVTHDAWTTRGIVPSWGGFYAFSSGGGVYAMSETYTDIAGPLKRTQVSRPLDLNSEQFSVSELEYRARVGASDLGRDATVTMRVSKNGGKTWGNEISRSLGDLGDYDARAIWRALGSYEVFVAEFSITDAADITTYSDALVEVA